MNDKKLIDLYDRLLTVVEKILIKLDDLDKRITDLEEKN